MQSFFALIAIEHIQLTSVFIAFATFCLGFVAYRKFLNKKLKEKQLDAVCDLVKEIHASYNLVFLNSEGNGRNYYFTIFDIAVSPEFDHGGKFFTFGQGEDQNFDDVVNWKFFGYYSNPLIPKSIADALKKFNVKHWNSIEYSKIQNTKCNIMGKVGVIEGDRSCMYYDDKLTVREFKSHCYMLRSSIEDWLYKYGIKDLNLSSSHHKKP